MMSLLVILDIAPPRELPVTLVALEGFLSRVGPLVRPQMIAYDKGFGTIRTFKRPFPCVVHLMDILIG